VRRSDKYRFYVILAALVVLQFLSEDGWGATAWRPTSCCWRS